MLKYKNLYLELKTLLKFIHKNPDTQLLIKCPICITNFKDSILIPCGHTACKDCLEYQKNIHKKIICPICRSDATNISNIFF